MHNNKVFKNATLKELETQVSKLRGEIQGLEFNITSNQLELKNKTERINELRRQMSKFTNPKTLQVSEHAMLRYVERVLKINLEEVKNNILTADVISMVEKLGGSGTYPNNLQSSLFSVVLKDNMVVTIKGDNQKKRNQKNRINMGTPGTGYDAEVEEIDPIWSKVKELVSKHVSEELSEKIIADLKAAGNFSFNEAKAEPEQEPATANL